MNALKRCDSNGTGHQCHLGAPQHGHLRQGIAHLAGGVVGDIAHRVDGLLGRTCRDQQFLALQVFLLGQMEEVLFGQDAEKKATVQQVLLSCLDTALRVLHPFMPFVTEEIWQKLPGSEGFLMQASFPTADKNLIDSSLEAEISDFSA